MTETPPAGWYADPADATRARYWDGATWTNQIKGAPSTDPRSSAPLARRRSVAIPILIAVGLLVVVGGAVGIVLLVSGGGASPTPSLTPSPSSTPSSTLANAAWSPASTDGWATHTSRSGAIEYLYDPSWTDVYSSDAESALGFDQSLPGVQSELAGYWVLDGSLSSGSTMLLVLAMSDGTDVSTAPLRLQAEQFVSSGASAAGADDYSIVYEHSFTTAQDYKAERVDYTMTVSGTALSATVICYADGVTFGFAYVASSNDFGTWEPDLLALVDSLVINEPPVSQPSP